MNCSYRKSCIYNFLATGAFRERANKGGMVESKLEGFTVLKVQSRLDNGYISCFHD